MAKAISARKMRDIRAGQHAWRVWSYPAKPEDYTSMAFSVDCFMPFGVKRHQEEDATRATHWPWVAVGDRYFKTKKQAERYLSELKMGHHSADMAAMIKWHRETSLLVGTITRSEKYSLPAKPSFLESSHE